ncbi:MAG: DNA double-strand break repair nuclease NurA [Candidatus ainarchaeum sp.]|nr:DNA double-strand break repair nuclease NurA [Candidatus ainarchaeum sp.]
MAAFSHNNKKAFLPLKVSLQRPVKLTEIRLRQIKKGFLRFYCMENINSVIRDAVSSIQSLDRKRSSFAKKVFPFLERDLSGFVSDELLEQKLVFPVKKSSLDCSVAGIDSGFVSKEFLALDLTLVRGMGSVFDYKNNKVEKAHYFPNFFSFPTPYLSNRALEIDEFACSKSIRRLLVEIGLAKEIVEKCRPEFCFLDGSIVPQYPDKPRSDSTIKDFYHEMIFAFQDLYRAAEKNNCILLGCVEDSRGSRFRSILQKEILEKEGISSSEIDDCYDAILLDYLLKQGERSMAFRYSNEIAKHPVLMDFEKKFAEQVHAFYLKPVALDRPMRIEFLHSSQNSFSEFTDKIAGIVFALSCLHREYAFPSILIEADLHARLKSEEIETVYQKILDKLGRSVNIRMRRSNRPF